MSYETLHYRNCVLCVVFVRDTVMLALYSPFAFTVHPCVLSAPHLLYSHLFPHPCHFPLLSFLELHFGLSLLLLVLPNCPPRTFYSIPGYLAFTPPLLCLSLSPFLSLPPRDDSKSSSHRTTLISSLPIPTISLLTSTCPPIHPFHLSRLLEWMIQIDALCTLSQSSHTQSTAPALSSLPLISLSLSISVTLSLSHTYTHTQTLHRSLYTWSISVLSGAGWYNGGTKTLHLFSWAVAIGDRALPPFLW